MKIAVLAGDGIGPEVTDAAISVLKKIEEKFNKKFDLRFGDVGGIAIDNHNAPLPKSTLDICKESNAIFLGAIGGPKWDNPDAKIRPEQGILALRKELGLYANIRPVQVYDALKNLSPLKNNLLDNVDFVVVRELTGGIYFGEKFRGDDYATDECKYSISEVERITDKACQIAMKRDKRLLSVDKANVLETSRLWRKTVTEYVKKNYPEIELEHGLVDSTAMKIIQNPSSFDVVLTENMFGDILTDEASVISGSLGLLPSASFGKDHMALYEPIHGSAPDIAGKNIANPVAAILSLAMMLRHSFELENEAKSVENAVHKVLKDGFLTSDLDHENPCSTIDFTQKVISVIS